MVNVDDWNYINRSNRDGRRAVGENGCNNNIVLRSRFPLFYAHIAYINIFYQHFTEMSMTNYKFKLYYVYIVARKGGHRGGKSIRVVRVNIARV